MTIPVVDCQTLYLPGHDQGAPKLATEKSAGYDMPAILSRACKRVDKSEFFCWKAQRKDKPKNRDTVIAMLKHEWQDEKEKVAQMAAFPTHYLSLSILPGETILVPLGIKTSFPDDRVCHLYARASSSTKEFRLGNCVGTIDADYRGEWYAAIRNEGKKPLVIKHGESICQAIFNQRYLAEWPSVAELSETVRGEGGFDSTGGKPVDAMSALGGTLTRAEAVGLAQKVATVPALGGDYDEAPPDSPAAAAVREMITEADPDEDEALNRLIAAEDARMMAGIDTSNDASDIPPDDAPVPMKPPAAVPVVTLDVNLVCNGTVVGPVCRIKPSVHGPMRKGGKDGDKAIITMLKKEMDILLPRVVPKLLDEVLK